MSETTTGQVEDKLVAEDSNTTNPTTNPAGATVQEDTNVQTTEAPAEKNSDESVALAKFAKGQGINDLSELSERELSLLKMARDTKSAYDKSNQERSKLAETATNLSELDDDATDVQKLSAKVQAMEFNQKKQTFFNGKDATLEPVMADIIAEKRKEFGDGYARALLSDLDTLYGMAQLKSGAIDTGTVSEVAKKEERSSINKTLAAGTNNQHARETKPVAPIRVTTEWIMNEYNPNNPEHRALVDAATKQQ